MVTILNTIKDQASADLCELHNNKSDALLEILHSVQKDQGYLSDAALRTIAQCLNISRAEIHGVVSFYHDYKFEPAASVTVKICKAEACQAVGANDFITEAENYYEVTLGEKSKDVKLEASYCLGNCALGPAIMIDNKLYGRATLESLSKLVAEAKP